MLSILDVLLLVLTCQHVLASPMKRYTNSTSGVQIPASSRLDLAGLHHTPYAYQASSSPDAALATFKKLFAQSSEPCESMIASTTQHSADAQRGVATYVPTSSNGSASWFAHSIQQSASLSEPVLPPNSTSVISHHTRHAVDGEGIEGTTTLTLRTTVAPGHSAKSAPENSNGALSSSSTILQLSSTSSVSYVSITRPAKDTTTTSSPAVWGSLTLTYHMSSSAEPSSLLRSSTVITDGSKHAEPTTTTTLTRGITSSAFAYPAPKRSSSSAASESSRAISSSQVLTSPSYSHHAPQQPTTTTQAGHVPIYSYAPPTLSAAPSPSSPSSPPKYQQPPHTRPGYSLPPIVSQHVPTPTTSAVATIPSTSGVQGITIVPIDTTAKIVYITVTTTEPGWTTTVAEQTVTAGRGWW